MMAHKKRSVAIGAVLVGALVVAAAWHQASGGIDGAGLPTIRVGARPVAMATDARTGHVFVVNGGDMVSPGSVSMLDGATKTVLGASDVGVDPAAIALDAHLGRAYVINRGPANGDGMSVGTGSVSVLDTGSGQVIRTLRLAMPPRAIATDTRTGHIFVVGGAWGKPGHVDVLDGVSGQLLHSGVIAPNPMAVVIDAGSGRAFIVGAGVDPRPGSVTTLDTRDGRVLRVVTAGQFPVTAVVDARTNHVFVANEGNATGGGNVSLLDATTGRVLRTIAPGPNPSALAVDSGTGHVYVLTNSKSVSVLDAGHGAIVGSVPLGAYLATASIAVDAARHRAYIANSNGTYTIDTLSEQARRVPAAKGSVVAIDGTGRAYVADADTASDDDPKGLAGLISGIVHGSPSHLGLVGAHSAGKVRVLDP